MYTLTHHFLTLSDDGTPIVESESVTVSDPSEIADAVRALTDHPGGRSGTTISLNVALLQPVSI